MGFVYDFSKLDFNRMNENPRWVQEYHIYGRVLDDEYYKSEVPEKPLDEKSEIQILLARLKRQS